MNCSCIICHSDIGQDSIICDICIHPQNPIERTELFTSILNTFRTTAQGDFNQLKILCKSLTNILSKINFDYTPIAEFDTKKHSNCIDTVAQSYMKNQERFDNFVPLSSEADGNCLYHSIKLLMPTMMASITELRVQAMITVVNNYETYNTIYPNLIEICDDLSEYCREVKDKQYAQIWDILGLCDALKCRIQLMCAKDPPLHQLQSTIFSPIHNVQDTANTIILLWTNTLNKQDLISLNMTFNVDHFVPLLQRAKVKEQPSNIYIIFI